MFTTRFNKDRRGFGSSDLYPSSRGSRQAAARASRREHVTSNTNKRNRRGSFFLEGSKEFRIYCEDAEGFPFGVITQGFCSMLSEAYDERHGRN